MEKKTPRDYHQDVHIGLAAAIQTRYEDAAATAMVADALEGWLAGYPEQARDVEHLAISACYNALMFEQHAPILKIGPIGIDASLIRSQPDEERAGGVMLALLTAPAFLHESRPQSGQVLLDDAEAMMEELERYGALQPYLQLLLAITRADFAEAALERRTAARQFSEALETADLLLNNRKHQKALKAAWGPVLFGNGPDLFEDGAGMVDTLLTRELGRLYRHATWGHARNAEDRQAAAREAVEAATTYGLSASSSPLELRPALLALGPDEWSDQLDGLLEAASAFPDEDQAASWQMVVMASLATTQARDGEYDEADRGLALAAVEAEACLDLPAAAVVSGDRLVFESQAKGMGLTPQDSESFLIDYAMALEAMEGEPLALAFRAQFDEPVAVALGAIFDDYRKRATPKRSQMLSVLLDALRAPDADNLMSVLRIGATRSELDKPLLYALDRLQRLRHALRSEPEAAAVIAQSIGDRVLFLSVGGGSIRADYSGEDYPRAAAALCIALNGAIEDESFESRDEIEALGAVAFEALPASVQGVIRRSRTIHLVPELATEPGNVPWELLHADGQFLGVSKVIARHASLQDAVRAIEPDVIPAELPRRAVGIAVSKPAGHTPLRFAEPEVDAVRTTLEDGGWTARLIVGATPADVVLRAMELAGVVHVAAHGAVRAGGEAVILGDRESLTVADIEDRPRLLRAFVYLNACSLARDRYLGGGLSRGIASRLLRAGSPCVVANLLPVEDERAAELSRRFYEAALTQPAGEALRLARLALHEAGVPPSRWGTTILLGDPQHLLSAGADKARTVEDAAARLLFDAMNLESETLEREAALERATAMLAEAPGDVRLAAACLWAASAKSVLTGSGHDTYLQLARIARALGSAPGEAFFLYCAASESADADEEEQRDDLDHAILALEPLQRLGSVWDRMHQDSLARRHKLDAPQEPRFIDGIVKVNDPDDPAVQAVLATQRSVDQQQIRREGELRLHRPEKTLADACWNAIVVGQCNRFRDGYAHIAFAIEMARKLVHLEVISPEAEVPTRWVLAGLVPFLWSQQRVFHLEHDLAEGQAATLGLAVSRVVANWDPPEQSATLARLRPLLDVVSERIRERQEDTGRFSRALEALNAGATVEKPTESLFDEFVACIESCGEISAEVRADAAAWAIGMLLETAHSASLRALPDRGAQGQLLKAQERLILDHAEGWFYPYLMKGFEGVRGKRFDFLQEWSWDDLGSPAQPD